MYIMDREDIKMLVNKWWDVFNDESLNFKQKSRCGNRKALRCGRNCYKIDHPRLLA